MNKSIFTALQATAFVCSFLYVAQSHASIGKGVDAIHDDCTKLKGQLTTVVSNRHFLCLAEIYQVDFYVGRSGAVKAITWVGKATPSFETLLGDFKSEYRDTYHGSTVKHRMKRNVIHESANLVVKRGGHARLHYGSIVLKNRD